MSGFGNFMKYLGMTTVPKRRVISCQNSVTVIGDSTMAYGVAATTGFTSQCPILFVNDQLIQAGGVGFDVVSMRAVAGVTVDSVITNQLPGALTDATDIIWIKCGVNNLVPAGDTLSVLLPKFKTLIRQCSASKKLVIVDAIIPISQSGSTTAKGRAFQIPSINAYLAALCATYDNVLFNDTYADMVDKASASMGPVANSVRPDDGLHQTTWGARLQALGTIGRLLSKIVLSKYKATVTPVTLPTFSGTGGSTIPNSGSITGTPPAGWTVLNNVTASGHAVTITSVGPDMVRFVITNSSAGAVNTRLTVSSNANMIAACAGGAGTVVQASIGFQASGLTSLLTFDCNIKISGPQAVTWGGGLNSTNELPAVVYGDIAFGGCRGTPPLLLTAVPTDVALQIDITLAASVGAATFDFYNPKFNVLT